jgi:hypothetical protein
VQHSAVKVAGGNQVLNIPVLVLVQVLNINHKERDQVQQFYMQSNLAYLKMRSLHPPKPRMCVYPALMTAHAPLGTGGNRRL